MLSFTDDFKTAATAPIRDPRALVKVHWGNSLQDTNISVSSNDINYVDRKSQITNNEESAGRKWAFIGSEFRADGTFHPMPDKDSGPQAGWFGAALSDGLGYFTTAPYIEINHHARPYTSVKVVGDNEYDEYPVNFDIHITHSGGVHVINVTGNMQRVWEAEFSVLTGVTSIKLEISMWSAPHTIVKILQLSGSFIETYDSDDIVSLSILEESNADTGAVPIGSVTANEIDLTLLNTDRRFSFGNTESEYNEVLLSGRKIEVWLGFVLPAGSSDVSGDVDGYIVLTEGGERVGYMPYGIYWSKDWISDYKGQETSTTAYDIVYKLRNNDFLRSLNYSGDAGGVIDDILEDAKNHIPELSWSVSPDISSLTWNNVYFPHKSYLETLKDIAEATASYIYVDRSGVLIVGSRLGVATPVGPEQKISLSEYFDFKSDPKLDELINSIRVGYTKYGLGAPGQEIYTDDTVFEIPAGEEELKLYISWAKAPVLISSVSVSFKIISSFRTMISDISVYATGADITVTGTAGDTFTLYATGRPYDLAENTEVTLNDAESVSRYGQREFSLKGNQLITSAQGALGIAGNLLSFYGNLRQDGTLTWPGNGLVAVGDTVEVTEFKSDTVETKDFFFIKRQTIDFDGSLNSELELRRG